MAQQIATTLRNDNHGDADFSYEALKAYQMLYLPKQYDGKFLRAWVMLNLQRNLPQGSTQKQLQQIEWHLSQLLDTQIQASPYAKDEQWVAQAQAAINRAPLSQRVYGRLKRLLLKQTDIAGQPGRFGRPANRAGVQPQKRQTGHRRCAGPVHLTRVLESVQ